MDILGVKIDNLYHQEILAKISQFFEDGRFHQIATVNPEFVLEAQKNPEFKNILNGCDLNVADGFGLNLAFWRFGKKLKTRFTGIDLMLEILKLAEDRGLGVFLACRKDGLSNFEETRAAILKKYPKLRIIGENLDKNTRSYIIPDTSYMILLCNFGAPEQEIFINSQKNVILGIGLGIGGSFDYLTGKVKRAPSWMRKFGLEWLFRLIQQPNRWRRIWNAIVIFPIKIIKK
jgi:N-acetylglucosaminyldiphosphoundecaprenol N-acetyl-beta-D-mannosaminyltransferase